MADIKQVPAIKLNHMNTREKHHELRYKNTERCHCASDLQKYWKHKKCVKIEPSNSSKLTLLKSLL